MLKSLLSLPAIVVSRGVALTRFVRRRPQVADWLARASRTNGRIRVLMSPRVVLRASGSSDSLTGFSLRANGRSLLSVGPSTPASSLVSSRATRVVAQRRAEQAVGPLDVEVLARDRAERRVRGVDERRDLLAAPGPPAPEDVHVVDQAGEVLACAWRPPS